MGTYFKQIGFTAIFFVLSFLEGITLTQAQSLSHNEMFNHPVLSAINQEVQSGLISKDEAMLQSIYAGFALDRLNSKYREKANQGPLIRCMTPVLMEYERMKDDLNFSTISEIESLLTPKASDEMLSYTSPSGNFILYYDVEGEDAVPPNDTNNSGVPDYIEKAAFAADSSYRYEVETMGFMDFLKDEPYEISFINFGSYGNTRSSGSTTTINIHRNFEGFPKNMHPEGNERGALYATIAHEIKHAIQYATNRWTGDAGKAAWIEMDATLMEEIVFDNVNDYYNYLMWYDSTNLNDWDRNSPREVSIFGNPETPTPRPYYHMTWMLYFAEKYGVDFWVDVWDIIRADYMDNENRGNLISFLGAIDKALELQDSNINQEHLINHIWHMSSGPDLMTPGFGFEERGEYPSANLNYTITQSPDSLINQYLRSYGAQYIRIQSPNITNTQPKLALESDVTGVGIGAIGFFKNGEIDIQFTVNPNSTSQTLQTIWSWDDLVDMRVAVVNTNRDDGGTYNLTITSSIPEEDTITQNYPNPFNPVTTIEFALAERKDVVVEVYDRIGRKISTLVDGELGRGYHTVQFNGTGLASGVYFYRVITDQASVTRKMVLVK